MVDTNQQAASGKKDIIAVVIVAFIGLMLGLNLFQLLEGDSTDSMVGDVAPHFELPIFGEEETLNLLDYRGQVVVMDFWATWCPPCREQMPALEAVAMDSESSADVVVFSINTDDESGSREEKVRGFLDSQELTLPTLMDTGSVRALYSVHRIPTLIVINPDGVVTHRSEGLHREEELRELISQARPSP